MSKHEKPFSAIRPERVRAEVVPTSEPEPNEIEPGSRERTLEYFNRATETILREIQADRFVQVLDRIASILESTRETKALEAQEEKLFQEKLTELSQRFAHPDRFLAWAQDELKNPKSWLSRSKNDYIKQRVIAQALKGEMAEIDAINLSLRLRELGIKHSLVDRIARIEKTVDQLENLDPETLTDQIMIHYIAASAHDRIKQKKDAGPSLLDKLLKRKLNPSRELEAAMDLRNDYALQQTEGLSEADRLMSQIPRAWLTSRGFDEYSPLFGQTYESVISTLRSEIAGAVDIFQTESSPIETENLEEYMRANRLSPAFQTMLVNLQPLIGHRQILEKIVFSTEASSVGDQAHYNPETRDMNFFTATTLIFSDQTTPLSETLVHETGHTLRPEINLPLAKAIRFMIALQVSLQMSGHTTHYSGAATAMYNDRIQKHVFNPLLVTRMLEKFIEDSGLEEEWAEMLRYALSPVRTLSPEKEAIVRETLAAYGIDFDALKQKIAETI